MNILDSVNSKQKDLLFDIRRSIRYHDRRKSFLERLHHITNFLTILMAGSVFFDLAKPGDTAWWLYPLAVSAALFSATDMVIGYSKQAGIHSNLKDRFADLEIEMISGDLEENAWIKYQRDRLNIEKDEPPIYRALDSLCHNELLIAQGYSKEKNPTEFAYVGWFARLTSNVFKWPNLDVTYNNHQSIKAA